MLDAMACFDVPGASGVAWDLRGGMKLGVHSINAAHSRSRGNNDVNL
jgi:hypothetical protein